MSNLTDETRETEWAVRWTPTSPLVSTGAKPPWSADYARWNRNTTATVYQKTTLIQTVTTVTEGDWVEVDA